MLADKDIDAALTLLERWEDGDVSAQGSESAVGSDDEVGDRQPTMPYPKGE